MGSAKLAGSLQIGDGLNELRISPGFLDALGVRRGDHIGCCFFDHSEAIELELAQDRGLAAPGGAGQDEASHRGPLLRRCSEPAASSISLATLRQAATGLLRVMSHSMSE